jgi:hypothetical protein
MQKQFISDQMQADEVLEMDKAPDSSKTTVEEVFSLFYSTDPLRPGMHWPFVVGNRTYATDGYLMVGCNTDKIDFSYENKEKPIFIDGVIPKVNMQEVLDMDNVEWASLMKADETISKVENVECGHCKGEGKVEDSLYYKKRYHTYEYECPVCDGSGLEEEEQEVPTVNKTFGREDLVKLKDSYFYLWRFYTLKKVRDLTGGDVELISYSGSGKAVLFRVGIFEILMMPIIASDDESEKVLLSFGE